MNVIGRCFSALVVVVLAACCAAGCQPRPASRAPAATGAGPPLAAISPLPAPSLSPIVASVTPAGEAGTLAQVRVVFAGDLIPLERLESPAENEILAHFSLQPAFAGRFRFLTPRMIGFEADRAWPPATRVRVTVTRGLRDVGGRVLDRDLAWTFETPAIAIGDLPGKDDARTRYDLSPKIRFTANVALDRASLEAHAFAAPRGRPDERVALVVPPDTASPSASPQPMRTPPPEEAFDPSQRDHAYVLVPSRPLAKATTYDVVIGAGVAPRDGNLPSNTPFRGYLTTHDDLRFAGVSVRGGGRFAGGDPVLIFTTPIDPASIGALHLSPAPPRGATPFAVVDDGVVGINASLLAPETSYTVAIDASLRDTFGQRLGAARRATFRTGHLAPDVWAPSGENLFPASRDVRLDVVAVNAPGGVRAEFRALAPRDVVQWGTPSGADDRDDVLPAALHWPAFDARGPRDVERTFEIPLRAKLGARAGALAYGVRAPREDGEPFVATGIVELTDLGAFAQYFPDSARVIVHRISDGTPVAGARVDVYPSQADAEKKTVPSACASATTGADGVASLATAAYAACARGDRGENEAPPFVAIVRSGAGWAYVRTDAYSGAFGSFFNGWSSATPIARGTIFSDRELYQPGETAQLTMAGWFLIDGVLRRGPAPSYALTLEVPDGSKRDLGRRTLDAYGMASFAVALRAGDPLGIYVVRASAGDGEQLTGDFRVAEFKPPNFKVDLRLDRDVALAGGSVAATATNAYLFGAPLAGTSTHYTVTRSAAGFTPKGYDGFTFGRQWFWPDQPPEAETDVLDTTAANGAGGTSRVAVPVATALPYAMSYEVDAETTDASNVAVSDSKTFTALPSGTLIGVKADDVGTAGRALDVAVVAADPAGRALAGTRVRLELQAATYASATQIVEGAEQPVESVSYRTADAREVTTAAKPVHVALTPPKPGDYRIRATPVAGGGASGAAETDAETWVGGNGEGAWYAHDPNALTVKLDKSTYAPGATATALVRSPFPNAEIRLAVIRHGVLWETTARTASAAPAFRFTVTPAMLPNAVVQAFAVRRGAPPSRPPADGGNALARVGFAPFDVSLAGKYLRATVRADRASLAPAARQTVHVHLADGARRPVSGELTLIVANDAVLQLSGYRPPDLVKTVYAEQPISTRFSDDRAQLVLHTIEKPAEKGWGFGGGLSGEEADPRVRRRFRPLAYFAGALHTNANGDASASFALPDDLTTWRVMVVAASADGRFGNAETTFRTTEPLVANPVFPQFARPGDAFDAGVAVTNGTGATGTLRTDATLTPPLAFVRDGVDVAEASFDAPLQRVTQAYRFAVVARATGTSTATVRVRSAAGSDAFAIPVPVRDADVSEAVAQTGTTTTSATVGIDTGSSNANGDALDVALGSSPIPEIVVAARAALEGDERLAFLASARLAVAADLIRLGARAGSDVTAMRARAAAEIATLRALRHADGGFAPYARARASDPWDSLPALAALARARDANAGDAALLAGAHAYAAAVLADPAHAARWCTSDLCKAQLRLEALDALAAAGDVRATFLDEIDARRDRLSFADRARLARLESAVPAYRSRAASLAASLETSFAVTARGAAVNLPARYSWLDDPVVAQAEALRLEIVRGAPAETLDRLTRALLDMRRNGSFGCACENAAALGALADLAARESPPSFTATAVLGTRTIARERFAGARAPQRSVTVPARALLAGRTTIALAKDGAGTLHYAVTYRYRLGAGAPGRLNGLRVTRIVRLANAPGVLATLGLSPRTAPLTLQPARVYDVELEIVADHPVERVAIADPLPAGLEAVDTSFATSAAQHAPSGSWEIGDQQIRADRIEAYADHLDAGVYRLRYLVRTVTPGTFLWPGAEAHLAERPDEFGRTAATSVVVSAAR